jgi:putative DNA primase/helicase
MFMKSAGFKPETGDCPTFNNFLDQCCCGDGEYKAYSLRVMGYCLTGETREQVFFNPIGSGANGKTTLLTSIQTIMGGYCAAVPEALIVDRGKSCETELTILNGARLAILADCPAGRLNLSVIKTLTGGDIVTARHLYHSHFSFENKAKLIFASNHKLRLSEYGDAIRRRLRVLPFRFKPETPDKGLPQKLFSEAPQILNLLIGEAARWYAESLPSCKIVEAESNQFINSQNWVLTLINDKLSERNEYTAVEAFDLYRRWVAENGAKPVTKSRLRDLMTENGWIYKKMRQPDGTQPYVFQKIVNLLNSTHGARVKESFGKIENFGTFGTPSSLAGQPNDESGPVLF